ncbi:MAG: DUF547 domain-containing protein [Spirochaetes bacterium]|nr:DUF547 domain-containing protein [Spirochaetota bacterium]
MKWLWPIFILLPWACAVDDNSYATVLARHVKEGVVDYPAMRKDDSKALLDRFIDEGGKVHWDKLEEREAKALLINLYNAATLRLILEHPEISSITNLKNPWDQKIFQVGEKFISLNELENGIIRPKFRDARVHLVLNCSARSCPPLLSKPLRADTLENQLDDACVGALGNARLIRPNRIGASGDSNSLGLSRIFQWYEGDFVASFGSLEGFLARYRGGNKIIGGLSLAAPI